MMRPKFISVLLCLSFTNASASLLSSNLHLTLAFDLTGSTKADQYSRNAQRLAQASLLNLRAGDHFTGIRICSSAATVVDTKLSAQFSRSEIAKLAALLTQPCKGKGSAITSGLNLAAAAAARSNLPDVVVVYSDGALLNDAGRAGFQKAAARLFGQARSVFFAGLSTEFSGNISVRDDFLKSLGQYQSDKRAIFAGQADLAQGFQRFAEAMRKARQ